MHQAPNGGSLIAKISDPFSGQGRRWVVKQDFKSYFQHSYPQQNTKNIRKSASTSRYLNGGSKKSQNVDGGKGKEAGIITREAIIPAGFTKKSVSIQHYWQSSPSPLREGVRGWGTLQRATS